MIRITYTPELWSNLILFFGAWGSFAVKVITTSSSNSWKIELRLHLSTSNFPFSSCKLNDNTGFKSNVNAYSLGHIPHHRSVFVLSVRFFVVLFGLHDVLLKLWKLDSSSMNAMRICHQECRASEICTVFCFWDSSLIIAEHYSYTTNSAKIIMKAYYLILSSSGFFCSTSLRPSDAVLLLM